MDTLDHEALRINPEWAKLPLFDRKGWKRVRFGDVVRVLKEQVNPASGEVDRYVAGEHMETENVHIRRWGTVGDGYLGPAFIRRFRKGQVLYGSRRTYLKKVAVAEWDGVTANTTLVLEAIEGKLLQRLLPWLMLSERFTRHSVQESKGSTNPYINWPDIAKFEFDLPPLDQQRRISEMLAAVDEAENANARLKHCGDALRKNMLQEAFAARNKHPRRLVKDAGAVQLGRQRAPQYQTGKFTKPYLRVANVMDDYFDYSDVMSMDFDERDFEKFRLAPGDILLNEGQSLELVGRCAMYDGAIPDCCFQKTLLRFRAGKEVFPEWALAYFQYCLYFGIFAAVALKTTSIAHLTAVRFEAMEMPVPAKSVQERFISEYQKIGSTGKAIASKEESTTTLRIALVNAFC